MRSIRLGRPQLLAYGLPAFWALALAYFAEMAPNHGVTDARAFMTRWVERFEQTGKNGSGQQQVAHPHGPAVGSVTGRSNVENAEHDDRQPETKETHHRSAPSRR